ncbi:MAG: peptidyl-prolyl cis-trans isomerase, partial [Gammaproteobacteria bacterium]|nr:peptidyl-prolyl cis-trans isomerase [Gammaproteobacteria bacterium]
MMKIGKTALLWALALAAGCERTPDASKPAESEAAPIAVVNGKKISADVLETYVRAVAGRPVKDLTAEQRNDAVDSLVRLYLIEQEAERQGLAQDKTNAAMIELSRLEVLQRALTANYLKGKEPTEQELRAEYDAQMAAAPRTEYRVRHILVQSEEFARALQARLAKGARFEALAAENSIDEQSKVRGGDLGWAMPNSFVAPFAQALLSLKKGQTSPNPVQTQYGWHIIRVDDIRETQLPSFEQVKDRLNQIVLGKKFKAYTDE